jgi:hypothetical protein
MQQQIANSVKQRLAARPQPQTHPDSDVLNAYTERTLPAGERTQVLLHLAECSDCRKVVSLVSSQLESSPNLRAVSARTSFWIPAFRWSAAAAVVAVAAALVIERPWHKGMDTFSPSAPVAQMHQTPASSVADPVFIAPGATVPASGSESSGSAEAGRQAVLAKKSIAAETRGGGGGRQPDEAPPVPAIPASPTSSFVRSEKGVLDAGATLRSSGQDYLNTNVLKKETQAENTSIDGIASSDAKGLPSAPSPRGSDMRTFPAVSREAVNGYAFDVIIVPPATRAGLAPGPPNPTTLPKFSWVVRAPKRVGEVVSKVEKASIGPAGEMGRLAPKGLASPNLKLADSGSENKTQKCTQWRISDGTLMQSTDSTQWHEAYPQGSDLQLKVLVTQGEQIWAGGNNATIIHSWNAGVNWETLKVPDSGDITAITVDDGWQVKTSNGQTFVTQDHGKTWVPLQAQPK